MSKLDKRIEINKLEKENRKNRLEDKLKHQEYYGEMKKLLGHITKNFNETASKNLALGEQTLRAIDWQNQQLDKQTKAISEAGSQINEATSWIQEAGSQIDENTFKI